MADNKHDLNGERTPLVLLALSDHRVVQPGQVIVLDKNYSEFHAVDDDEFDSSSSLLMGIADWSGIGQEGPGFVQLAKPKNRTWARPLVGSGNLPHFGINYIDSWMLRADVLRTYISTGTCKVRSYENVDILDREYLAAAMQFVLMKFNRTTMLLLQRAPKEARELRLALAGILAPHMPNAAALTVAIQYMIASEYIWREAEKVVAEEGHELPTAAVITHALGCSESTFNRIRLEARISKLKKGQTLTRSQIDKLIDACSDPKWRKHISVLRRWSSFSSK